MSKIIYDSFADYAYSTSGISGTRGPTGGAGPTGPAGIGATGFVDLVSNQVISGEKFFSKSIVANGPGSINITQSSLFSFPLNAILNGADAHFFNSFAKPNVTGSTPAHVYNVFIEGAADNSAGPSYALYVQQGITGFNDQIQLSDSGLRFLNAPGTGLVRTGGDLISIVDDQDIQILAPNVIRFLKPALAQNGFRIGLAGNVIANKLSDTLVFADTVDPGTTFTAGPFALIGFTTQVDIVCSLSTTAASNNWEQCTIQAFDVSPTQMSFKIHNFGPDPTSGEALINYIIWEKNV